MRWVGLDDQAKNTTIGRIISLSSREWKPLVSITDSRLRFGTVTRTKQRLHVQSEMDRRAARGASQRSGKRQQQ